MMPIPADYAGGIVVHAASGWPLCRNDVFGQLERPRSGKQTSQCAVCASWGNSLTLWLAGLALYWDLHLRPTAIAISAFFKYHNTPAAWLWWGG